MTARLSWTGKASAERLTEVGYHPPAAAQLGPIIDGTAADRKGAFLRGLLRSTLKAGLKRIQSPGH